VKSRHLLLAVLVYVTLDLSLAAMPGAFVFSLEDSAESTRTRARSAGEAISPPPPAQAPGLVALLAPADAVTAPPALVDPPPIRLIESRTPHAPPHAAPPSEDPH
jgi:hypothetical protein